jgi:pSer/pThr/pTyr-binding forkhead associated (FHA) protein
MSDLILEIVEGKDAGRQIPLRGVISAGRADDAQLKLDDPEVSRQHLRVEPSGDGAVVADLGSTNGTFVNDQPIHARRVIRAGDRIRAGLTVLELRTAGQVRSQPSAARPIPQISAVGGDVLRPEPTDRLPSSKALPPFAPDGAAPQRERGPDQPDPGYAAVAALVDTRVKRQTNVAVFALLSAAGLAVLIFFGVR